MKWQVHNALPRRLRQFLYTLVVEVISRAKYLLFRTLNPTRCRVRKEFNRNLLTGLYREILLREPDPEGFANYIIPLNMGRVTPLQVEEFMRKSAEFRMLVRPLREEVECVYDRFIFRKPTHAEIVQHINNFRGRFKVFQDLVRAVQTGNLRTHRGIRPLNVEMDITNQCNLRCVMCYFSDERVRKRRREDLSLEGFSRIAQQIFPLSHKVSLSIGTEPLIHPHFSETLAILAKYEIFRTYINTNGLLLTENIITQMIQLKFSHVTISMDAATKHTYERIRVGSKFEKVIGNMRAINRLKEKAGSATPAISLAFVLMRSNIRELPAFIRLAHELKAIWVNAMHMVPYEVLNNSHESLVLEKGLCNRMLDEARSLATKYGIVFVGPDKFPVSQGTAGRMSQIEPAGVANTQVRPASIKALSNRFDLNLREGDEERFCCPFPWYFVGIDPYGNVLPCGWWYTERPMGNIKTQSFEEIWNSEQYRTLRSELMFRKLRKTCQQCPASGMGRVEDENAFLAHSLGDLPPLNRS